jgi:hypothetical protein
MTLLLSVAQLNYVVGDMAGNAQKSSTLHARVISAAFACC